MRRRSLLCLFLVVLAVAPARFDLALGLRFEPAQVHADAEPPAASILESRKQFKLGVEQARLGHWAEALVAFQVSYALVPNPAALFNLAGAQHRTGKLLVSNANYRRFNASTAPGISPSHRKVAETQMARIEASIPRLRVVVEGLRPDDRLLIDDKRIYMNELDHNLWVDPGSHTVSVLRPGGHEEVRRIVLSQGDRRLMQFRVF
ncbi:MAG: hypothetical protein QM778_34020 [Myxococcales bacterium]